MRPVGRYVHIAPTTIWAFNIIPTFQSPAYAARFACVFPSSVKRSFIQSYFIVFIIIFIFCIVNSQNLITNILTFNYDYLIIVFVIIRLKERICSDLFAKDTIRNYESWHCVQPLAIRLMRVEIKKRNQ